MVQLLLRSSDTAGIAAFNHVSQINALVLLRLFRFVCLIQQLEDQGHAHILAVKRLLEIAGSGIAVHGHADLVYPGQRVQNAHVGLCRLHLLRRQNIAVLQAEILLLAGKALPLDTGHVQDIQLRDSLFQACGLDILHTFFHQNTLLHIAGKLQLLRGDEHHLDPLVAGHGFQQGVYRAAVFQIAAEADGQMVQPPLFPVNGQQVRQGLGGVVVAAVTGIDHGNGGIEGCHKGRALLGVAHGDDIRVAADDPCRVGYALPFCAGGAGCLGKAQHVSAQLIHGRLKAEPCAGRGFEKQRGQLPAPAFFAVGCGIGNNVICRVHQALDLLCGQVQNIDQVSHFFIQLSSEGLFLKAISRSTSSGAI